MDLTTCDDQGRPWDFDDYRQRARARELLRRDKPMVLIGSPMCTAFCRLQSINFARMHPDRVRVILTRARMHLNFVCSLYEEQVREGRHFIHGHPAGATSWEEPAVRRVMKLPGVHVSRVDACQYGMVGQQAGEQWPVKKPTRWMSSMSSVNKALSRTCSGQGGGYVRVAGHMLRAQVGEPNRQLSTHINFAAPYSWAFETTFRRQVRCRRDVRGS